MLNVANSTKDNDDILQMLESARRQTSVDIPLAVPDPVYHRAMSRRKSLAQDDLLNAFALPSTPPESEEDSSSSEDEDTSSDEDSDEVGEEEEKDDDNEVSFNRTSIKTKTPENKRAVSSTVKKRSTRKIPFLRSRSTSSQSFNDVKPSSSRFQRMGRRLSLNNLLSNVGEDEIVTIDRDGVSRTKSRRASLPVINPLQTTQKMTETLPQVKEIDNDSQSNKERKKSSSRIFSLRKNRASTSDSSDSEDNSTKDSFGSQSEKRSERERSNCHRHPVPRGTKQRIQISQTLQADEVETKRMAMGLNEASDNNMGPSNEADPSVEDRGGRKSVKNVLKKSFFMSRKNKKKNSFSAPSSSENPETQPKRQFKRRTSRLEMGIPIEEVFSGVEFKTIEKPTAVKVSDDENDLIEDPDDLIKSVEEQRRKSSIADQERLEDSFAALTSDDPNEFEPKVEVQS